MFRAAAIFFTVFFSLRSAFANTPEARVLLGNPRSLSILDMKPVSTFEDLNYGTETQDLKLTDDLSKLSPFTSVKLRRALAWRIAAQTFQPVKLEIATPKLNFGMKNFPEFEVPLWLTWLDAAEGNSVFTPLYSSLGVDGRKQRTPIGFDFAHNAVFGWSDFVRKQNFFSEEKLQKLFAGLDTPAKALGVRGPPHVLIDPMVVGHHITSAFEIDDCLSGKIDTSPDKVPRDPNQFALCFGKEIPREGALIKAIWHRVDNSEGLPVYDTGVSGIQNLESNEFEWKPKEFLPTKRLPKNSEILTIQVPSGQVYQLVGFHIMSKILRHWAWITLWWSPSPDSDFGEDRPPELNGKNNWLKNYKMCVVLDHTEGAQQGWNEFAANQGGLSEAIKASAEMNGDYSWCSNPYIEKGAMNAKTNCIGCHQHGGGSRSPEELMNLRGSPFSNWVLGKARQSFPSDYLWSFGATQPTGGHHEDFESNTTTTLALEMKTVMDYFTLLDETSTANHLRLHKFQQSLPMGFEFFKPRQQFVQPINP